MKDGKKPKVTTMLRSKLREGPMIKEAYDAGYLEALEKFGGVWHGNRGVWDATKNLGSAVGGLITGNRAAPPLTDSVMGMGRALKTKFPVLEKTNIHSMDVAPGVYQAEKGIQNTRRQMMAPTKTTIGATPPMPRQVPPMPRPVDMPMQHPGMPARM